MTLKVIQGTPEESISGSGLQIGDYLQSENEISLQGNYQVPADGREIFGGVLDSTTDTYPKLYANMSLSRVAGNTVSVVDGFTANGGLSGSIDSDMVYMWENTLNNDDVYLWNSGSTALLGLSFGSNNSSVKGVCSSDDGQNALFFGDATSVDSLYWQFTSDGGSTLTSLYSESYSTNPTVTNAACIQCDPTGTNYIAMHYDNDANNWQLRSLVHNASSLGLIYTFTEYTTSSQITMKASRDLQIIVALPSHTISTTEGRISTDGGSSFAPLVYEAEVSLGMAQAPVSSVSPDGSNIFILNPTTFIGQLSTDGGSIWTVLDTKIGDYDVSTYDFADVGSCEFSKTDNFLAITYRLRRIIDAVFEPWLRVSYNKGVSWTLIETLKATTWTSRGFIISNDGLTTLENLGLTSEQLVETTISEGKFLKDTSSATLPSRILADKA